MGRLLGLGYFLNTTSLVLFLFLLLVLLEIFVQLLTRFIYRLESALSFYFLRQLICNFCIICLTNTVQPSITDSIFPIEDKKSLLINFSQLLLLSHMKWFNRIAKIFHLLLQISLCALLCMFIYGFGRIDIKINVFMLLLFINSFILVMFSVETSSFWILYSPFVHRICVGME